jgi:hypothetical protein
MYVKNEGIGYNNIMLNRIIACFVICSFNLMNSGCSAGVVQTPDVNTTPTSTTMIVPGKPPTDQSNNFCAEACQHMRDLFCQQGYPVATNSDVTCGKDDVKIGCVSCETFCEDVVSGGGVWLDANCVSQILPAEVTPPTCPEIETCAERAFRN